MHQLHQRNLFQLLLTLMTGILTGCSSLPKGVTAVSELDTARYMGRWYEIDRTDNRFERGLSNVTAEYALRNDGSIRVVNRGFKTAKGEWQQIEGKAKSRGRRGDGQLKVSFFGPFYAAYNVIAIDDDYQTALVCGSSHKYLWLLARDPAPAPETRTTFLGKADAFGFDTNALIRVEHSSQ